MGCGRYRGSHASDHWEESGHGYALELGTQRVWDYLGDAYVHRLIQSKAGGKPVEAGDPPVRRAHVPATHAQSAADGECCSGAAGRAGPGATPDGDVEDPLHQVLALSKFDALVGEYNHLLVTQLESQRMHFEGLLIRAGTEAEDKVRRRGDCLSRGGRILRQDQGGKRSARWSPVQPVFSSDRRSPRPRQRRMPRVRRPGKPRRGRVQPCRHSKQPRGSW